VTDIADITGIDTASAEDIADELAEESQDSPEPEQQDTKPVEKKTKRSRRTKSELELDALREQNELIAAGLGATPEQVAALNCETPEDEIGYRPADFRNPGGKQLAYVDARYVMEVLDREVGPTNWYTEYIKHDDGSVECTLSINLRGFGAVRKTDVGTASTIEPVKGAYSDAFKRAAVHFGIARDLYDERADTPAAPAPAPAPQAAAPAAAPAQQATISEATAPAPDAAAAAPAEPAAEQKVASWVCPIHGTGRVQPAGVSKRTGKAYSAFWVCDTPGCRQTGGNA